MTDISVGFPGTWSIGGQDSGNISQIQDLGTQWGFNLTRDKSVKKHSQHVARDFGFKSLYASRPPAFSIVDPVKQGSSLGWTIKFTVGAKKYSGTVDQISIHKVGAHARIVVSKASVSEV